jgi:hypothetical protein
MRRTLVFPMFILLVWVAIPSEMESRQTVLQPTSAAQGNDGLILLKGRVNAGLDDLKVNIERKIGKDLESVSIAFTEAESISKSLRTAYWFKAPLTVISGTLTTLKALKSINGVKDAISHQDKPLGLAAVWLALQDAEEAGQNLQFAIDGPAYTSDVQRMIESARATQHPLARFDDRVYKRTIEDWLLGGQGALRLRISPQRFSLPCGGRKLESLDGVRTLMTRLSSEFEGMKSKINNGSYSREQLTDFQQQIRVINRAIIASGGQAAIARYRAYQPGPRDGCQVVEKEIPLGAIAQYQTILGQAYAGFDQKLRFEQISTITTSAGAVVKYVTLRVGDNQALTITSKLLGYEKFGEFLYKKALPTSDARDHIVNLPQEMLLALPSEMSGVWSIILDLKSYIERGDSRLNSSPQAKAGIRQVDFRNFTYRLPNLTRDFELGEVRLYNGKTNNGGLGTDRPNCELYQIAYGDLTSDGNEEAVVVLIFNLGGSAFWMDGQIFTLKNGRPMLLTKFGAGDRGHGRVRTVAVNKTLLIVDFDIPGNDDASCCPSYYQVVKYRWNGRNMVEVEKSPIKKRPQSGNQVSRQSSTPSVLTEAELRKQLFQQLIADGEINMKDCVDMGETNPVKLLSTEKVDLNGDGVPEIKVFGEQGCAFQGARRGMQWFYRRSGGGYVLLGSIPAAEQIELLNTSTNGYRDLSVIYPAGNNYPEFRVTFKFDGHRYQDSKRRP